MGRPIDENLWNAWRQRMARYERWSGTVAGFCAREGVSVVTFYQWRRKLEARSVTGDVRPEIRETTAVAPRFLPVRIATAKPVEIEFANGVRVRVPLGAARTLEAVLAAAARCYVGAAAEEARGC
jgi:transposase-like protein